MNWLQAATAAPVDEDRRATGADQERPQRADAGQREPHVAERRLVGDRRYDAAHVRRVLLDREEAAGIGRAGDERQRKPELTVRVALRCFPVRFRKYCAGIASQGLRSIAANRGHGRTTGTGRQGGHAACAQVPGLSNHVTNMIMPLSYSVSRIGLSVQCHPARPDCDPIAASLPHGRAARLRDHFCPPLHDPDRSFFAIRRSRSRPSWLW